MNSIAKVKKELVEQKILRDGWMVGLFVLLVLANGFLVVWSVTHIRQVDIEVPIRFSSLANFDQLGRWYQLYEITAISVLVAALNTTLATLLHKKNRILSVFLVIAAIMVAILAAAILIGFSTIRYGTN